jgi:fibronectin type 3 domain-containing protein
MGRYAWQLQSFTFDTTHLNRQSTVGQKPFATTDARTARIAGQVVRSSSASTYAIRIGVDSLFPEKITLVSRRSGRMFQHRAPISVGSRDLIKRRLRVEPLEDRIYLHGGALDDHHTHLDVTIRAFLSSSLSEIGSYLHADSVPEFNELTMSDAGAGGTIAVPTAAIYALSSIPLLSSLPGAVASLYLDFDGDLAAAWGGYTNITTPAFDQDGDATTFSDSELSTIQSIWQQVSEDYSPFNINVTTVEPTSFANGVAERIAIGGDGAWTGGRYGGISYVNSFTSSIVNTSFVFPVNLVNGYAKYTAEAVSHEAGHALGLQHQSQFSGATKVAEYYTGPGDGTAPVMGNSYNATRGLWWYGTSTSSTTYQDDMAVVARSANGFGYRADDYGNSAATAAPLTVSAGQLSGSGVITQTSDVDYFSFAADAGQVNLWVNVPSGYNDLDARLELRDVSGALIAAADPTDSFGASITATVAGGSYRLAVASHGHYGDVGQYTVGGTIVPSTTVIPAATNLAAVVSSSQVSLSWTDNAANESVYDVARSTDGVNWTTIAALAANSTAFSDVGVSPGGSYFYRVCACDSTQTSAFSNQVQATLAPVAPAGLMAAVISSSQINLAWNDVSGESSYKVQRSADAGTTWATVATVGANVTTYQNTGLAAATTYYFRIVASNAGGDSAPSNLASGTTLTAPTPPIAPSGLVAAAASAKQVNLSWQDRSLNENGFLVERSQNGGKSWTQIGSVGANATSYADSTVSARKAYMYRVRAFNDGGNSAYSNAVAVTTPRAASLTVTTSSHRTGHSLSHADLPSLYLPGSDSARIKHAINLDQSWMLAGSANAESQSSIDSNIAGSKSHLGSLRDSCEADFSASPNGATLAVPSSFSAGNSRIAAARSSTAVLSSQAAQAQFSAVAECFADVPWLDTLDVRSGMV